MVWLEAKEIKEGSEEIRGGKSEPALKVCNENHPLTGLRGGGYLLTGTTADNLRANAARLA